MASNKTIERIQQEVVSANKDKLCQATKKEVKDNELQAKIKLGREVQELEIKHKNWLLYEQMKMIKQELITMINEKKQN